MELTSGGGVMELTSGGGRGVMELTSGGRGVMVPFTLAMLEKAAI